MQPFHALKQHNNLLDSCTSFYNSSGNVNAMVVAFEKQALNMTSKFKYCDRIQYIFLISSLLKKSAALFYLANISSKSYPHVEKWMLPAHIRHRL
jgi:hypothetical protein